MAIFNQVWCTVIEQDGMHHVVTPTGQKIPGLITTITNDSAGVSAQCTITIHCNIAKDYEDAILKYQIL